MTDDKSLERKAAERFARDHGLERLSTEHIARLVELTPKIAQLGSRVPRPPEKSNAPAQRKQLSGESSQSR